jgi:hypothetical protein
VTTGGKDCATAYPVWTGQQDDNEDAVALALEVDDCRQGLAHKELKGDEAKCTALADSIGAQRGYSAGVISVAKMPEMLALCHSPVLASDPPVCGDKRLPKGVTAQDCEQWRDDAAGVEEPDDALAASLEACDAALRVRKGDLRYHKVIVIDEPQSESPWGIYTDSEDPLTGEKIAAAINVWSDINDYWAQRVVDQARYIRGELTTEDITDGDYVRQWAAAADAAGGNGAFPTMTREQLDRRLSEFTGAKPGAQHVPGAFAAKHPKEAKASWKLRQELRSVKASGKATSVMAPKYLARLNAARGSQTEAGLFNGMVQQLNGVGGGAVTDGLLDAFSPLRGGNPSVEHKLREMKHRALTASGACMLEAAEAPLDVSALTDVLEQKFGKFNPKDSPDVQFARADKMVKYLARRVHLSVIAHEMGHSIGMRHNFVGSADAWFYRPQYWQLRTSNGKVTKQCKDLSKTGGDCVGPRYFDPVTQEEKDNLLNMFMHTSIMDYPGETTQDVLGLGVYDFAAARMFYGDAVPVYADPMYSLDGSAAYTVLGKLDNFGGILGIALDFIDEEIGYRTLHYTELQGLFKVLTQCKEVNAAAFRPGRYDEARDGKWSALFDGFLVAVGGKTSRCRSQQVDYSTWDTMRAPTAAEYDGWMLPTAAVDKENRLRVPYALGSDEWSDLGNVSVYTHDNGADTYEIFNFLVTQQEVMHIFDNYRRGRQDFSVRGAVERAYDRYDVKLRDGAKGLTLFKNIYEDYSLEIGYDFSGYWDAIAPDWFKDNIIASAHVFDHFARKTFRPESGPHFFSEWGGDPVLRSAEDPLGDPTKTEVVVPNGATGYAGNVSFGGRPIENRFADNMGEYDFYFITNAGSYYDKINAAMMLTESVDNFISDTRQDFVDARYRATSIADLFPDGYRRLLAQVLTGDDLIKGPRVAATDTGIPQVDKEGFPAQGLGWTSWWGDKVQACFPAEGTTACSIYGLGSGTLDPLAPKNTAVLDPQVGFEVQKFFIAWTLAYLPENQKQNWIDMLRIWQVGELLGDPPLNRIEFHYPEGKSWVAMRYGTEEIFGKTVERGIAARILQYANELLVQAYETTDGPDQDNDGAPDWYLPVISDDTGLPLVRYDPTIAAIDGEWVYPEGDERCNADDNSGCTCSDNRACVLLQRYVEVPAYLYMALRDFGFIQPEQKGLYD